MTSTKIPSFFISSWYANQPTKKVVNKIVKMSRTKYIKNPIWTWLNPIYLDIHHLHMEVSGWCAHTASLSGKISIFFFLCFFFDFIQVKHWWKVKTGTFDLRYLGCKSKRGIFFSPFLGGRFLYCRSWYAIFFHPTLLQLLVFTCKPDCERLSRLNLITVHVLQFFNRGFLITRPDQWKDSIGKIYRRCSLSMPYRRSSLKPVVLTLNRLNQMNEGYCR